VSAKSERVVATLRAEIIDGTIPAGARLRQVEVAERLGVSTTPVREAFVALVREGLVVGEEHKGLMVFIPTEADLAENFAIRAELESLAAESSVPKLTDEDIDALARLVDDDRAFHSLLYSRAQMRKLASLIDDLRDVAEGWLERLDASENGARARSEHAAILEACRRRDAADAARLVAEHLSVVA
jgi:DNA-binding GntR family transcriptional regulator